MTKADWERLMCRFIGGDLDGPRFERAFLDAWREARDKGESEPYAVDLMFYEVDAYCADPALRAETDLDEAGLRDAARRLVDRLDEPWPPLPGDRSDTDKLEDFRRAAARLGLKGK